VTVGQRVEMLRPISTPVPAGARGRIVALVPPSGRAMVEWETGATSVIPESGDRVLVRTGEAEQPGPAPAARR
jgi:hypothetical protein